MSMRVTRAALACGLLLATAPMAPAPGVAQDSVEATPAASPSKRGGKRARAAEAKSATKRAKPASKRAKPRAASANAAPARAPSAEKPINAEPEPPRASGETKPVSNQGAAKTPPAPAEARAPNVGGASEAAAALSGDVDESVRKEGDSEIKVVEFGGLDIEGQLKTPQMLYFLNRLRAEFDRPELPHRSFMPELQRGTKEPAF